ncbi:uroporphyrinogen-III C-methyltransferase [Celerinatantimonas sp. YJH-8]|uniref:uroporphyrinogen-III C-methyltransferase n=1 Tax=Celerinatantimonas sp. YJH-8 TaxID=3228714 RepID=UPI0038C63B7B
MLPIPMLSQPIEEMMTQAKSKTLLAPGEVALVGAGPGDPELLTLKAMHYLQQADVVFYDRLVSDEIIALLPQSAQPIFVGKKSGAHCIEQSVIIAWLKQQASAQKRVVRLKGGDPFVFGRGGEEMQALQQAGITVHVVPGITAALGCAATAGIPLTHRDFAQRVTLVTGHPQPGGQLNWHGLAQPQQTLVFYMGISQATLIRQQLLSEGMSDSMPIALVEHGTREDQRVIQGQLSALPQIAATVQSPALLIIGAVAALSSKM